MYYTSYIKLHKTQSKSQTCWIIPKTNSIRSLWNRKQVWTKWLFFILWIGQHWNYWGYLSFVLKIVSKLILEFPLDYLELFLFYLGFSIVKVAWSIYYLVTYSTYLFHLIAIEYILNNCATVIYINSVV